MNKIENIGQLAKPVQTNKQIGLRQLTTYNYK